MGTVNIGIVCFCWPILFREDRQGKARQLQLKQVPKRGPAPTLTVHAASSSGSEIYYDESNFTSRVTKATPLPCFSPLVVQHFKSATECKVWRELIWAANCYVSKYPDLNSAGEYYSTGKNMFIAFPYIMREGEHKWVRIMLLMFFIVYVRHFVVKVHLGNNNKSCNNWQINVHPNGWTLGFL